MFPLSPKQLSGNISLLSLFKNQTRRIIMNIKKRILGFALAVTIILSGLNTVPERVKADTSNPKAQAEVIPSPAKSSATMAIGAAKQIKINNLKKTTKVTYKSDKPKTVKVSKKGKITALKAGRANINITVRTKTGEIKYGYAVIVKKPSFKQKKLKLIKGKSKTLKIKNISKQAKITWKSSNKKAATVSAKGSVKAIKKGKADISAVIKVAGKTYTLKQKVTVNNKPTLAIKVSNKLDDKKKALIKTTDENIAIKGKITGKNKLKKLSIIYTDHTNKPTNIKPSGKRNWSVNVPLSIGRTRVKITAEGKKKEKVTKVISINRTNKTIEYSTNVKIADIKEAKEVSDSVVKSFRDDNNTSDRASDDTIVVLVKEDSELLRKINAGELQQGNAYVLPQVEHFIAGFTGIYNRHQAPRDSAYPDYAYEEVIFNYPTIDKLFDKDINLDFSGGIDKENPIAFTLIGDKTTINPKVNGGQIGMTNKVRAMGYGDDNNYPGTGFQKEEFADGLKLTAASENGKLSYTINWEDVVIYDKDGIKNKPGDMSGEIKFSGKLGLDDMYAEGGIEWHPDYIGGLFDHGKWLPDQMKLKLNYKKVANLELKGKTEFKTEEFVQNLNAGFKNEASLVGLDISGVETFEKKWVIGAVGLRLLSKTGVSGNINQIAQQSSLADPIIMLFIFIDIDGNITVEGGIKTENSTSYVKGFNIQRNGFIGNYGSQTENFSAGRHSRINDNYTLDIYDSTENKNSFSVYGKATAGLKFGAGLGTGLMIAGICPVTVTGEVFRKGQIEAEVEGKLAFPLKDSKIDGKVTMEVSQGAIAEADFRLAIDDKPDLELKYHNEWEIPLGEPIVLQIPKEDEKKKDKKEEEKKEKKEEKKTKETTGKVAVKFKYDEVRKFSEKMAAVKVNGSWGFINKSGKEVIKPEYDAASDFENGFARVKLNGRWGFIDKEGKIVIPIKYKWALPFKEGLAGVGRGFIFTESGYVDMSGNEVIPFKSYGSIGVFSEGLAPVSLSGRYGFINRSGEVVIPFEYANAWFFNDANIAPVKINGKWGAIDRSGAEIIPPKYDATSQETDKVVNDITLGGFSEGMLSVKLNGKWGYVNQYGVEVVPMLFDEVAIFFRGGMASVRLNDKWGYVNLSGDIVVQPKYDEANDFFDDLTSVSLNGKWGYVDKAGKEIIPLKYDSAKEFNDGLGAVKVGDKWGYIDKTGKEVIPFIYEDADYFSESLAAVKKDGKWGFIKK